LPDYVEEKTQGRIRASDVVRFDLATVRAGVVEQLMQLTDNQCCVVDAVTQDDLDRFAADILVAAAKGKKFLFRSAASLLTALAQLPPQPIGPEAMASYVRGGKPGAVIVGSHVQKTTAQLAELLQAPGILGIEIDVAQLRDDPTAAATILESVWQQSNQAHAVGQTVVIYTSRSELQFADVQARLDFGIAVSALLMDVLRHLPETIGFLISKGGITSNDTLSDGLALRSADLLGQVIAGVSMVKTPADHPQFPDLPVVLFPGNVGDETALATVYRRLSRN
jgi:uncharacterized protein YgbK (DUF1537 family)